MKKIIAMVLCLLLVTAMSVSAFAAGASFTVDASAKTLYRGDTVILTVNVACGEKATSYGLMLDYDSNVFELVEGSCTVAGTLVSSFNNGFAFMYQNATAYTGAVGTVTLKVKDNATFGDTTITGDASIKNGTDAVEASGFSVSLTVDCKHNYSEWTEAGNGHSQTCSICNDVKTADHTWNSGEVTTKPTHYEEGVKTFTCSACKATKTEKIAKEEAHEWSEWTANDDGKTHTRKCGCEASETLSHEWSKWVLEAENEYKRECADCDASETIVLDGEVNITAKDNPANTNIGNTDIELIEKLLSDEELCKVVAGSDVKVYLKVTDITEGVSEETKAKAEAKAGDAEIGMYLDIDLFKQIGTDPETQITQTNSDVKVTITVPENMINTNTAVNRTYKVVRVHEDGNGNLVADVIEGVFNSDDNTFTFESDKFSTFALVYTDKSISNGSNPPGAYFSPNNSNISTTPSTPDKPNASTGGENSAVWALAVLMLTAGCAVTAKKFRKNVSER